MRRVALLLAVCLVVVWPASPSARRWAITLPFSTTYNCAEQVQFDGVWVNCQGLGRNGDETTSAGGKEQITTAANYPLGGGGRGQRHMVGQSSGGPNGSGGIFYSFQSQQPEVFVRWYVRFQSGMRLGGNAAPIARNFKMVYFSGGSCGQSGGCYFDLKGGTLGFIFNGTPYDGPGGAGWDGIFPGGVSDGRWIQMEIRLKRPTSGAPGIAQWWVNGVLKLNRTDIAGTSTGMWGFEFPSNHQFTTTGGDMAIDFDDVAVRTTGPIGLITGTPPPPLSPPGAATNVRVIRGV